MFCVKSYHYYFYTMPLGMFSLETSLYLEIDFICSCGSEHRSVQVITDLIPVLIHLEPLGKSFTHLENVQTPLFSS